jgi:predicted unusual protein kinase regulating ubiquinone biosynthesis (AarF/ABC1/UbiB family)
MARKDDSIPSGRIQRTAKVGQALGSSGARYAGTRARNVVRSKDDAVAEIDKRHLETAEKMVDALGQLKGAAMKIGQLASFIDTEFLPPEYRELYQEKLADLRSSAPPMPWKKVREVLEEEWEEPPEDLFEHFEEEAAAAASIGQVHRATLPDGRKVAVKIQYPGVAKALRADMQNAGMIMRLAKTLAPGLDAKAAAEELKARVLEELDYEYEAQNQRTFARAYRGHPFIHVPDVITRLSRSRVLVSEWVDGAGFEEVKALPQAERDRFGEIVYRFCFGSIYHLRHFNADAHPGNYVAMEDGRVAFLDFGMTKQLDSEQIELEIVAVQAVLGEDPERLRTALADLGFLAKPKRVEAERLMEHVRAIGGWYLEDREVRIDSDYELMGRRMEFGVLAVLGQLGATRNWLRIGREWWFGDEPATELGREEWAYFESRGERRAARYSSRGG